MRVNMITCDKVYIELDDSVERRDIDYIELNRLIESLNIPVEPISCTVRVEKNSLNYKRMCKFFKKLFNEVNKNEN